MAVRPKNHNIRGINNGRPPIPDETLAQLADTDPHFRAACTAAGIEPTPRQYSKWSNKRGAAWAHR